MSERAPAAGLIAQFPSAERMLVALERLRSMGYSRLESFSPYPVSGVAGALRLPRPPMAAWVLGALVAGLVVGYLVQWYANVYHYPLNVGGRPLMSVQTWIPAMIATAVLFGAIAALVVFLVHARKPALRHPVFEVDGFERATADGFWVLVGSGDPRFDRAETTEALRAQGALRLLWIGDRNDGGEA